MRLGLRLRIGGGSSRLFRSLENRMIRGGLRCKVRYRVVSAPFFSPLIILFIFALTYVVALLTLQVRNVWNHLREFKRDVANRRSLRRLVHQRAKLLKYLKRTDRDRYERVLERLGLEPRA